MTVDPAALTFVPPPPPCDPDHLYGHPNDEACKSCGHMVIAHKSPSCMCSVCEAVSEAKSQLLRQAQR